MCARTRRAFSLISRSMPLWEGCTSVESWKRSSPTRWRRCDRSISGISSPAIAPAGVPCMLWPTNLAKSSVSPQSAPLTPLPRPRPRPDDGAARWQRGVGCPPPAGDHYTGFLGSGKTTPLNHILTSQHGLKIAVIVNEIGEIGIDAELIVSAGEGIMELSNGCICCSMNNDLVDRIFQVLERREPVDYLIVETTGLADPLPIILTFLRSEFRDRVRVDSTITVADAENFSLDLFDSPAAYNQFRYADAVLLNKCDLVEGRVLRTIEARIHEIKGDA